MSPPHHPDPQPCPACGVVLHRLLVVPWGSGKQTMAVAPWICAACAALGLIELATGAVALTPAWVWQVVQERNPTLWRTIADARARIKGDPDA